MDSFVSTSDMSSYFTSGEPDVHDDSTPAIGGLLVDNQYEPPQQCTICIIA
jgi:hypothetical protein